MWKQRTHTLYVCSLCGYGQYHRLVYCYKCPGLLEKREVPVPERAMPDKEKYEYLKTHGINWERKN